MALNFNKPIHSGIGICKYQLSNWVHSGICLDHQQPKLIFKPTFPIILIKQDKCWPYFFSFIQAKCRTEKDNKAYYQSFSSHGEQTYNHMKKPGQTHDTRFPRCLKSLSNTKFQSDVIGQRHCSYVMKQHCIELLHAIGFLKKK